MKTILLALSGAVVVCASGASAQTAAPTTPAAAPAVAPVIAPAVATPMIAPVPVVAGDTAVLRVGTKVPLKLSEELTTKGKKLRVGRRFQLEVAEAVMVNDQVVIPVGSPATGEVTEVRNKGMWGKSGHLTAQVLYATVNGRQIKLNGTFDDKGTAGGVGAAAVSAVVFLPAGFFMTGTSARVPVGAPVTAFVGEDVPLTFAPVTPNPMVVAPAAAPASAPAEQTASASNGTAN
jgi:hypothetical protein